MKRTNPYGFTLLEVLLVLVILSSVVVLGLNYTTQKIDETRRDKMSLQYQQILNASLAYYLASSTGGWPASIANLTSGGYLPNITMNNPWGNPYFVSSTTNMVFVYSQVPSGTPQTLAQANTIAGRLPMAYVTTLVPPNPSTPNLCTSSSSTCYLVAAATVPGQNLNNARSVNFANLYHHGACVPAPSCPSGMTPTILAVPVSVSGTNDSGSLNVYPLTSFTAYATGGPVAVPYSGTPTFGPVSPNLVYDCNLQNPLLNTARTPCNSTGTTPITGSGTYWRVCLKVLTQRGDISSNPNWAQTTWILALTRCAAANEPLGSDQTVTTP